MPPFGSRKAATPPPLAEPEPRPVTPSAEERLLHAEAALHGWNEELARLSAALEARTAERARLVADETASITTIVGTEEEIRAVRLEIERHQQRKAALYAEFHEASAEVRADRWQQLRPDLMAAELALAVAIKGYDVAVIRARELHNAAHHAGFSAELQAEFVTPPAYIHPFAFQEFVRVVEWRQAARQTPLVLDEGLWAEVASDTPRAAPRFVRNRVDHQMLGRLSALETRTVRFLHDCDNKGSTVVPGYSRIRAGTTMLLSARQAGYVVMTGLAEYADTETAEAAATAAA